jgi:hypothetical protein
VDLIRTGSTAVPDYAPPLALSAIQGPSRPLDAAARAVLEPRLGADFGGIRIHDDAQAAAAADTVNARAYTIGSHIVFGGGEYSPSSERGRRVLAHELVHTIQQGPSTAVHGPVPVSRPDDPLEREADTTVAHALAAPDLRPAAQQPRVRGVPTLARQGGGHAQQVDPVEQARALAWGMTFKVYARLSGLGPAAPPGREAQADLQRRADQLELRNLARTIFSWNDPNMDQITEIVGHMRDYLGPGMKTVRAPASEPFCGFHEAYVVGHNPPVHLCPQFFAAKPDHQAETLIHEAAHLAGIGDPTGESYCAVFDCASSCGGFSSADGWAHFIHCASGQAPQKPLVVTGGQRSPGGRP